MDEAHLASLPLFSSLGARERRALAQIADELSLPEGRRLVREGEYAYEFFVLEEGTAAVMAGDEHVRDLGPGDFFGEIGILAKEHRTATVISTSAVNLVVMTRGALRAIDREYPGVADALHREIKARLDADSERSGA